MNNVKFVGMGNNDKELKQNRDWVHYPLLRHRFVSLLYDEAEEGVMYKMKWSEHVVPELLEKHKETRTGLVLVSLGVDDGRSNLIPAIMGVVWVRITPMECDN